MTARFLERDMALPSGGFAASLSAETGGVEGSTYTWTRSDLERVLDAGELELAERHLGIEPAGSTRAVTLHRPGGRATDAEAVDAVLAKLDIARRERPQPEADTKMITSWNAMTARGLIAAGAAFGDEAAVARGIELGRLLAEVCTREDGVVREPDDVSVSRVRLLEDAAHLVSALLAVHEATGEGALLETAQELQYDALQRFSEGHLLFATSADTDLPVRPREGSDSAVPSGVSTMIENSVRLGAATGDAWFYAYARGALEQLWGVMDYAPEQAGRALSAAVQLELAASAE
jgi:uncharacterized protein YyaL (SSP411 family)